MIQNIFQIILLIATSDSFSLTLVMEKIFFGPWASSKHIIYPKC